MATTTVVASGATAYLALAFYDQHTRTRWAAVVDRELGAGADQRTIEAFFGRRAIRYNLDVSFHHQYVAVLPQPWLAQLVADRQVQLFLNLRDDMTLGDVEVEVSYTFL